MIVGVGGGCCLFVWYVVFTGVGCDLNFDKHQPTPVPYQQQKYYPSDSEVCVDTAINPTLFTPAFYISVSATRAVARGAASIT
ncbi:hypothetical protein ACHAWC_005940, partial [Mediolabrus comicus]